MYTYILTPPLHPFFILVKAVERNKSPPCVSKSHVMLTFFQYLLPHFYYQPKLYFCSQTWPHPQAQHYSTFFHIRTTQHSHGQVGACDANVCIDLEEKCSHIKFAGNSNNTTTKMMMVMVIMIVMNVMAMVVVVESVYLDKSLKLVELSVNGRCGPLYC